MMQVPVAPSPQYQTAVPQPSYNAVKIDIHNPQVNTPDYSQNQPAVAPVYNSIPAASVYEMPQQSIYQPQPSVSQPSAVKEAPAVPAPVIVQPTTINNAPAPVVSVPEVAPKVEIQAPEAAKPQVDLNEFISKLTNPDFEVQANTMESIADMAQSSPQKATELLDIKVVDALLGIMSKDSSKLEGPTPQQLQIREKIMSGQSVTEAETAEANKITPMEQSERNKQYAIYTVAILDKLYASEIEKMDKTVVPLTELPGAAGIVEQIKGNPNPMVRVAGVDAMSFIQRPEYKQDLTTLFTVAKNDKDLNVQKAAETALKKLDQLTTPQSASTEAKK